MAIAVCFHPKGTTLAIPVMPRAARIAPPVDS